MKLLVLFICLQALLAAPTKKAAKKAANDPNDYRGLTPFFLQDPTDQMCLGPHGFTVCDENALWILTRRAGKKTYSLVSLLQPGKDVCLTQGTKLFGLFNSDRVVLAPCNKNSAKNWQWDFIDQSHVKLSNSAQCLVRGKKTFKNSASLQNCKKDEFVALLYHPTAVHENGFYLKAADGACFDGHKFRSCTGAGANKLLWGIGLKFIWGEARRYLFNFAPSERSTCIVAKGSEVEVGACSSSQALTWGIANGALTYQYGKKCVASKVDDVGVLTSCSEGSEFVSIEVPTLYTNEQLADMLQSQVK
jgi:hypothetical protein